MKHAACGMQQALSKPAACDKLQHVARMRLTCNKLLASCGMLCTLYLINPWPVQVARLAFAIDMHICIWQCLWCFVRCTLGAGRVHVVSRLQ